MATCQFTFDDGRIEIIAGPGAIGRNPAIAGAKIVIHDPSVSKTHLEFGLDEGRPWIMERGSTNGSSLRRGHDAAVPLPKGERRYVLPGDVVSIGSRQFSVSVAGPTPPTSAAPVGVAGRG
ncbi:MAG: FHA domain-containing protein [Propionibacteriaceae bacterium]|jgi:pSer/pThr/pTyr-binding forkhead associated (FHA) protein|nr:FHA domain-containing protein [Propionibacteriaceae bacterium]